MPRHASPRLRALTVLLLAGGVVSCDALVQPNPPDYSATPKAMLERMVYVMEHRSFKRDSIDWEHFRDTVLGPVQYSDSLKYIRKQIRLALTLLNDNHTFFRESDGLYVNYTRPGCPSDPPFAKEEIPGNIGYLRVGAFSGSPVHELLYTSTIQNAMREADSDSLIGWIIDLRGNSGGNMFPMIAALWPFLQGEVGKLVAPTGDELPWRVDGYMSYLGDLRLSVVSSPYQPQNMGHRVAVLTDGLVASSGEATAISLRGRPNTRSFGTPTCGVSTGIQTYHLGFGFMLGLADSRMADRTGTVYGGRVVPDEVIPDTREVMRSAVAWIQAH